MKKIHTFLMIFILIGIAIALNKRTHEFSKEEFIETMLPYAQEIEKQYGYYTSVTLAQAALESNFGKSGLSKYPNYNLFGIKFDGNGQAVSFITQEQDKEGNISTINAKFQKYDSYQQSFEGYGKLFTKSQWLKNYYRNFLSATTVEESVQALTGTYATDTHYDKKLLKIIEQYNLNQYNLKNK